MTDPPPVIIVTGVPRSGTSMAMQMLQAGGLPILSDGVRAPDVSNPRGYLEFEPVKRLRTDRSWLDQASGKAVKVIHLLVPELPTDRPYKVIFMHRALDQVVRSQSRMLQAGGHASLGIAPERMMAVFSAQIASVQAWLAAHPNFEVCELQHAECVVDPGGMAERVNRFLGGHLDEARMRLVVDPSLHRNRGDQA
ncbi:MAG: sulfotransferase [Alphaproteobacteria bacterium]|nr:sulfotransferase [Alphaproteobacteria bacterium]